MLRSSLALLLIATIVAPLMAQSPPGMPPLRPVDTPEIVENVPMTDGAGPAVSEQSGSLLLDLDTSAVNEPQAPPPARQVPMSAQPSVNVPTPPEPQPVTRSAARPASPVVSPSVVNRPPPSELIMVPGRNELITVARVHLNRLVTPFPNPVVKTTSDRTTTSAEGRTVWVATESTDPVTLFIMDEADPDTALTVTLVPRDIPAISVHLTLPGYQPSVQRLAAQGDAEAFEHTLPYLSTIRELFRQVAMREIPPGYGMRTLAGGHPLMPDCVLPGIEVVPSQELTGHAIIMLVSRLTNRTTHPLDIDESMCASDGVLAVAAWPVVELRPGQSTELYIAVRRPTSAPANARPSVLVGGY